MDKNKIFNTYKPITTKTLEYCVKRTKHQTVNMLSRISTHNVMSPASRFWTRTVSIFYMSRLLQCAWIISILLSQKMKNQKPLDLLLQL